MPVRFEIIGSDLGVGYSLIKGLEMRIVANGLSSPSGLFGLFRLENSILVKSLHRGEDFGIYEATNSDGILVSIEFRFYKGLEFVANAEIKSILIVPLGQ